MKKIKKTLLMTLIVCLMLLMPTTAFAKSKKAKAAIKAYKKFLSQEKIYVVPYDTYFLRYNRYLYWCWDSDVSFCLVYLNNDKIPELFVKGKFYSGRDSCAAVFEYKKGAVKRSAWEWYDEGCGFQFSDITRYCKKRGVLEVKGWENLGDDYDEDINYMKAILKYKNKNSCCYLTDWGTYTHANWKYYKGYKKGLRKYTKGRSLTKVKWHANTPANRKKYLK